MIGHTIVQTSEGIRTLLREYVEKRTGKPKGVERLVDQLILEYLESEGDEPGFALSPQKLGGGNSILTNLAAQGLQGVI